MILILGSNHTVGPPGGLMMIIRSALTPDQLCQLNFTRTCQSLPLSYFKRATGLLEEELFPLKSKSDRLYIGSLILNHCDECGQNDINSGRAILYLPNMAKTLPWFH